LRVVLVVLDLVLFDLVLLDLVARAELLRDELVLRARLEVRAGREPLPLPELCFSAVCRTWSSKSSGSSDARAFASSITPLACRVKKSLLTSAKKPAPAAGRTIHRRLVPPPVRRFPCAASATSERRSA